MAELTKTAVLEFLDLATDAMEDALSALDDGDLAEAKKILAQALDDIVEEEGEEEPEED